MRIIYSLPLFCVTDKGTCPVQACLNNGVCRAKSNGDLYCDCPAAFAQSLICAALPALPATTAPIDFDVRLNTSSSTQNSTALNYTSQPSTSSPWNCASTISCIVPAIVAPIGGVLLIVFIVILTSNRKQVGRGVRAYGNKPKSRPPNGRKTISTVNASLETSFHDGISESQSQEAQVVKSTACRLSTQNWQGYSYRPTDLNTYN
jgi:hypothetical protein